MADYHAVIQLKTSRCTRYYENIHAHKNHFAKMGKPILGEEAYVGFDPVTELVKEITVREFNDIVITTKRKY